MSFDKVKAFLKEHNVEFVDFRFTDPRGKWQHTAMTADNIDADVIKNGIPFDGSSISGWKEINESDMLMVPDPDSIHIDPFTAQQTAIMCCNIVEPDTGEGYRRDPRSTAIRAEQYLQNTGLGDKAYFGPELEFFVFDDVRFDVSMNGSFVELDSEEGPYNTGRDYHAGNTGHRPKSKGGYFPVQPVDSLNDLRAEMVTVLREVGIAPVLHHHEVAPSQCELGFDFDTLVKTADNVQKYKYVVHNVAHSYGKTATFMPKPINGDNGSGMHVHQSIWKDGKPTFAGDKYADLSQNCLYYIGGIIKHAKALSAFTNASTNSYKRLVPGFEAPVLLAYSSRNRSASIRIPYTNSTKAKRIETRFPDSSGNPYYTFTALLMAGLDGIKNKIDPGEAMEENLYDLSEKKQKRIPTVSRSLRGALEELQKDHKFLLEGGVMSKDQINAYIELKMEEVIGIEHLPHPGEFVRYYSV